MTDICLSTDPGSCPGFALPFCAPDGAHEPHGCANVAVLLSENDWWPRWSCASCAADDLDWRHAFPTVCEEFFGPQPCEGEGGAFSPCSYPPLRPEDEVYLRANATARPAYWNRDVIRLEMFATIDAARRERDAARRERDEMQAEAEQLASDLDTERRRRAFDALNEKALAESCKGLVEVLATARTERETARADLATLRRLAREVLDLSGNYLSEKNGTADQARNALRAAMPTEADSG